MVGIVNCRLRGDRSDIGRLILPPRLEFDRSKINTRMFWPVPLSKSGDVGDHLRLIPPEPRGTDRGGAAWPAIPTIDHRRSRQLLMNSKVVASLEAFQRSRD